MRSQDDKRVRRRRITRPLTDLGPTGATTGIYIIQLQGGGAGIFYYSFIIQFMLLKFVVVVYSQRYECLF